jgi:hypothetical protein
MRKIPTKVQSKNESENRFQEDVIQCFKQIWTALNLVVPTSPGGTTTSAQWKDDVFTGPGTTYNLSYLPITGTILVFLNTGYAGPGDWSLSGKVVTMTAALLAGEQLVCHYQHL